uniref:Uncharacterized protein n=1 Tax=Arundo donax TaxID=35708 RepID=A0A0A9C1F4_ARUDO
MTVRLSNTVEKGPINKTLEAYIRILIIT